MPKKKKDTTYDYYDKNTFWNDHFVVNEYINELISGDKRKDWMRFITETYFKDSIGKIKAISVGAGNGWQDRDLNKLLKFQKLDGFDVSESLIADARKKAPSKAFSYGIKDLNAEKLPHADYYDLALNVAALHHIENMDHIVSEVYKVLKPGGLFVHFEYIGPKRNQYSDADLYYMNYMQSLFPEQFVGREVIGRPSIEVMMREDPSEAVGSELIIPSLSKFFDIEYIRYYNGGLLYQVLYNHIQNFDPKNIEHNSMLRIALELEKEMTWSGKVKPLFAFIVARKPLNGTKKGTLKHAIKSRLIRLIEKI